MRGQDRWQEYHAPGGDLIDYKMGPDDMVFANGGGSYSFCDGAELLVTVIGGQAQCP